MRSFENQNSFNLSLDENNWNTFEKLFPRKNQVHEEKCKKKTQNFWDRQQNNAYISFLYQYRQVLESKEDRKKCKVFKNMSQKLFEFGFDKSAQQCRGHHKKLMARYKSIENITKHLERRLGCSESQTRPAPSKFSREMMKKEPISDNESSTKKEASIFMESGHLCGEKQFYETESQESL